MKSNDLYPMDLSISIFLYKPPIDRFRFYQNIINIKTTP